MPVDIRLLLLQVHLIYIRYYTPAEPGRSYTLGCSHGSVLIIFENLCSFSSCFFFFLFLRMGDLGLNSFSLSVSSNGSSSLFIILRSVSHSKSYVYSQIVPRLRGRFWIETDSHRVVRTVHISLKSLCYALLVKGILLFWIRFFIFTILNIFFC